MRVVQPSQGRLIKRLVEPTFFAFSCTTISGSIKGLSFCCLYCLYDNKHDFMAM